MPARIHGQRRGPAARTYRIWMNMKSRCSNPKMTQYAAYGGRGITVCKRWESFANFFADMGEAPEGLTIERLDNAKGYKPGNCKWGTRTEQGRNTKRVRLSAEVAAEIRASSEGPTALAQRYGVHRSTIKHVRRGRTWKEDTL